MRVLDVACAHLTKTVRVTRRTVRLSPVRVDRGFLVLAPGDGLKACLRALAVGGPPPERAGGGKA